MSSPCEFEDIIREMHGDVKVLVSEFKNMNGSLRETKSSLNDHKIESKIYRSKIDALWTVLQTIKYVFIFLFGSGVLWKAIDVFKGFVK